MILKIKSNEKKGKFCLIEEKKEDKESKENGKANLCLKSHLILLKLFDVPKKVMYGDNEENCAINDVEYLTKIKSEEKIVISDFHINIVRSFFETLLMRLKIVNSKNNLNKCIFNKYFNIINKLIHKFSRKDKLIYSN